MSLEQHELKRKRAASYIAAYSQLLLGQAGRFDEFREKVDIMLGGPMPSIFALMQMTSQVRSSGRPVLWIHHSAEAPAIPNISMVVPIGDGTHVLENCMLYQGANDDRASLVPDSFKLGAYGFDDEVRLIHRPKSPARSFDAATAVMRRTYGRLYAIEAAQEERGETFALPTLARAA